MTNETADTGRKTLQLPVVHIRVFGQVSADRMRLLAVLLPGNA